MKFVYLVLALGVIKCIVIYKVYHSIPALEIKRRARAADKRSAKLHKVAAYGKSVDVLLWLAGTACFIVLATWSARTNWWLGLVVMVLTAWLIVWGKFPATGWAGGVAAITAPAYAKFFYYADPVLFRLGKLFPNNLSLHTGLYERRDLTDLLGNQYRQSDNRIPESDLKIAYNSIVFGDKTVAKIMTPLSKVKTVGANDTIGPLLMDELHKSGFSRFPVVKDTAKSAPLQIVGTLYLNDLVGYEGGGKVKDLASNKVDFINEDSNLREALGAFLKTHHHLMIVVNSFEEVVGMLSLEDVLNQIIGKNTFDDFDSYQDPKAVATMTAQQPPDEPKAAEPEQTDETVVE